MDEKDLIAEKIKTLVENAERMKVNELHNALDNLVLEAEQKDEEIEYLLVQYLSDTKINPEVRTEMIRIAGVQQDSSFLVPLKKIIDSDPNSRTRQEAILAVAKFNDRRALNILNQALQKINNPMLQRVLNEEISRIKENNPILALLPRFQEGQKNPKTFKSALQVLKNILTPNDATIFTKFLNNKDPLLQNGAYEILCVAGDIFHDSDILDYYQKHFNQIACLAEAECDELYLLTYHIRQYLSRYQFLIEEQIPTLKEHFLKVKDFRVKQILLSLICKSKEKNSIKFINDVFFHKETDKNLKTTIINELSGNEAATDFLFEIYRSNEEPSSLKKHIIKSLLNIKQGLDYFIQEFFQLSFSDQELIVQNLPYAGQHDLVGFIKQIFQADIYRLKEILLSKVRETFEFSVKDLLFDPDGEREFYFMGDKYFDTIIRLFPITSVKKLMEKIAAHDVSVSKAKKYLNKISEVVPHELIFNFEDKEFITTVFNKVIKSNNIEFNVQFLGILKHIKTLDTKSYRNLREGINLFIAKRETKLTPGEKGELSRIKRSLKDLYYELQRIEDGAAVFGRFIKRKEMDFDLLREIMIRHHMAVVKHIDTFIAYLSQHLQYTTSANMDSWIAFLSEFPRISQLLQPMVESKADKIQGLVGRELAQLVESFDQHPLRIALNFRNRALTAILREQFQEAAPELPLTIDESQLRQSDILLCDPEILRDLALQTRKLPEKIYLFLEQSAGYSEFKSYNTRNFVRPFEFYRITKEILQKLYL